MSQDQSYCEFGQDSLKYLYKFVPVVCKANIWFLLRGPSEERAAAG